MEDDDIINDHHSSDEVEADKLAKKVLLLETITKNCASSPHEILQKINAAIHSGDGSKLDATVLCGGATNYSFKVFVDKHPELRVYAKICFEFALWNPDRSAHYDLMRVENEYKIMEEVSSLVQGCVVTTLALYDVEHEGNKMKLFMTEWSKSDEQFCNQFIDGVVDPRIAPKVANTLATLNTIKDFDPDFNKTVQPCMENMFEHMKAVALAAIKDPSDRTKAYLASLGEEVVAKIMDANYANYHEPDCLIHSDSHAFNILVEAKPSIEQLEDFGPDGSVTLCDWEMAMAGPIGRDIGLAITFPLSCMIAHGLKGQVGAIQSIEVFINSLLDTYCSRMVEAGKTTKEMAKIMRNIVGTLGMFEYLAYYILRVPHYAPVDAQDKERHYDSVGILGLKLMRLGFDTDYVPESTGVAEIRAEFDSLRGAEMNAAHQVFASTKRKMQPRKMSMLRTMNRRISDTEFLYAANESMRMLSISGSIKE